MNAYAMSQEENIVTFKLENDYVFDKGELAEIKSLKLSFFDDLLKLYFCLLDWMIESKSYRLLPPGDQVCFKPNDHSDLLKRKLYYLIRWRTSHVKTGYAPDGMPRIEVKSVSKRETSENELVDQYDKAKQYFGQFADLTGFNIEHQKARERLGKMF